LRVFIVNNCQGSLNLKNLTIAHGSANCAGGGVFSARPLTVTNCTFFGNTSPVPPPVACAAGTQGGAIFIAGCDANTTLTVTNSTFSNNSSDSGGAIFSTSNGTITNSTFSNNNSNSTGGAAASAIEVQGSGSMPTIVVKNSILANSTSTGGMPASCVGLDNGSIGNGGDNMSDDASCGFGTSTGASG